MKSIVKLALCAVLATLAAVPVSAQIGRRFPSEKKVIKDPKTGVELVFLTSQQGHVHPTFKPDGTEIEIQSAMLSEDNRSMNICIVKMPQELIDRYKK